MEKTNITKCITKDVENMLIEEIIRELKKNSFTYKNFEDVILEVKEFLKIMQLSKLFPTITILFT